MRKRNRNRWLLTIGLMLVAGQGHPQGVFSWQAELDSIPQDGFYQILLTPEIVSKCNGLRLADLRILGPGNRWVAYVLKDSQGGADTGGQWLSVPGGVLTQKDSSDKHSYVDLRFAEAYEIDQLNFFIRDPVFFKREATIFAEGGTPGEWVLVGEFSLAPNTAGLRISPVMTRRLRIEIANADNPPLVIREISAFQASRFLVTYLKAGAGYQILTGNHQAIQPEYDLKYFTDSLKVKPAILVPGTMRQTAVANDQPAAPGGKKAATEHSGSVLLWSILFAILILLVYFSVRLINAISQRERNDRI